MAVVIQINDVDREKKISFQLHNFLVFFFGIATTQWLTVLCTQNDLLFDCWLFIIQWMLVIERNNRPTNQPHFRCISFVSPSVFKKCLCERFCLRLAWFCPILTRWDKGISQLTVNLFQFFSIHFIFNTHHIHFFRKSPFLWFYCFCMCVCVWTHVLLCGRIASHRIASKRHCEFYV